tara:strand:- start:6481 stop:7053 length:573 start_codon:yes stop_codon:yes gene_type:complete
MSSDNQISENIRWLLWSEDKKSNNWPSLINKKLKNKWSDEQVKSFLEGRKSPTDPEIVQLAESFHIEESELRNSDMVRDSNTNVLLANLEYLINSMARGGKKLLALDLGINQTTISRWLNGKHPPQKPTLRQLVSYFGLSMGTDLEISPVFLTYRPLSFQDRRAWLHKEIDDLPINELNKLFPALKKLLD